MRKTRQRPRRSDSSERRRIGGRTIRVAAAAAVLAAVMWWRWPTAQLLPVPATRYNILLVTIDTARADHFGAYGYARARTRHIDALAAEGVRFDRVFTTAPITLPAHASILTGLFPFEHGVRNNGNFYLPGGIETLATVLKNQGYRTAAYFFPATKTAIAVVVNDDRGTPDDALRAVIDTLFP